MGWSRLVSEATGTALLAAQFLSGVFALLILLRIAFILSANPIGQFSQELVYLRGVDLRRVAYVIFTVVVVEMLQLLYPFTVRQGWLKSYPDVNLFADTAQGILILSACVTGLLVVRRYTHRALDRRIRESMETLAYLESQRRRRRQVESGAWQPPADDE